MTFDQIQDMLTDLRDEYSEWVPALLGEIDNVKEALSELEDQQEVANELPIRLWRA